MSERGQIRHLSPEEEIRFLKEKGFGKIAQRAARLIAKRHRREMKNLVFSQYRRISGVLKTNPELLPEWMVKDDDGAIMVHPGYPGQKGYAIHGREIFRVPSVFGCGHDKKQVEHGEFGAAFDGIVYYWENRVPKDPKDQKIETKINYNL